MSDTQQQHQSSNGAAVPALAIPRTSELDLYETACRALAQAKAVDEVTSIRAQAEAIRAYAKQAKNKQMEIDAAEIRIRAERRLGELMAAQGETIGKAKGSQGMGTSAGYNQTRTQDAPPTLAEAGIDKNLAHRARTYAAVPDEKFENLLDKKRRRESVRVVLDPEFQMEAEAAARDIEIERDERIALSGAGELAGENERLNKQIAMLDRRVATLMSDNESLKFRERMWRERAMAAGWKERADG